MVGFQTYVDSKIILKVLISKRLGNPRSGSPECREASQKLITLQDAGWPYDAESWPYDAESTSQSMSDNVAKSRQVLQSVAECHKVKPSWQR